MRLLVALIEVSCTRSAVYSVAGRSMLCPDCYVDCV